MSKKKCDLCQKNKASVHYTEVEGDQIAKLFICEGCARRKGLIDDLADDSLETGGLEELISSISKPNALAPPSELTCSACGLSYAEFEQSSRLGCAQCYEQFREFLQPLLQEYHKHPSHAPVTGFVDAKSNEAQVRKLEVRLQEAIRKEDFEAAAHLRDEIQALEKKTQRGQKGNDPASDKDSTS